MARMTDRQLEKLIDDDTENGGTGYTEIMRELWRARSSEARLMEATKRLLSVPGVYPGPRGYETISARAAAAIKAAEEGT